VVGRCGVPRADPLDDGELDMLYVPVYCQLKKRRLFVVKEREIYGNSSYPLFVLGARDSVPSKQLCACIVYAVQCALCLFNCSLPGARDGYVKVGRTRILRIRIVLGIAAFGKACATMERGFRYLRLSRRVRKREESRSREDRASGP
jgi:hypothetical protein